jgi:hypothetical protein
MSGLKEINQNVDLLFTNIIMKWMDDGKILLYTPEEVSYKYGNFVKTWENCSCRYIISCLHFNLRSL